MQIHVITDKLPILPRGELLGLDTETSTHGPFHPDFKIRLLQLATEEEAWVFRMDDPRQRSFVTDFLNDDLNSFASHTDYDMLSAINFLDVDDNIVYRNIDTRLLGTMASPEDRLGMNDLDTLSRKYLGGEFIKDSQALSRRFKEFWEESFPGVRGSIEEIKNHGWNNIPINDPIYVAYAGKDSLATRRLVEPLVRLSGAPLSLLRMELWLSAQAILMRLRGMLVDPIAFNELYKEAKDNCDLHAEAFGQIVTEPYMKGRGVNRQTYYKPVSPRSGRKVAKFLAEHGADFTGFPMTDGGEKAAKAGTLTFEQEVEGHYASLSKKHKALVAEMNLDPIGQEAAEALFGYKEMIYTQTKLEEVEAAKDHKGYVHPSLRTLGTVTGRMSSSGPNTQNYSRSDTGMREIFISRPDYVFIGCDFSQLEIRVAAALSGCPVLTSSVHGGKSMHEITMEAMNVDKPMAKIINFTLQYNGGAKALREQSGIAIEEGKRMVKKFWQTYTGLAKYRDWTMGFEDEVRTISNRKIPVPQWEGKSLVYKNLNYFLQSAAREMICASWYRYVNTPGTERGQVFAVIHDELIVEVPIEEMNFHLAALEHSMVFDLRGVKIEAEAQVLADCFGRSRWTTGTKALEYAAYREKHGISIKA